MLRDPQIPTGASGKFAIVFAVFQNGTSYSERTRTFKTHGDQSKGNFCHSKDTARAQINQVMFYAKKWEKKECISKGNISIRTCRLPYFVTQEFGTR